MEKYRPFWGETAANQQELTRAYTAINGSPPTRNAALTDYVNAVMSIFDGNVWRIFDLQAMRNLMTANKLSEFSPQLFLTSRKF